MRPSGVQLLQKYLTYSLGGAERQREGSGRAERQREGSGRAERQRERL